MCDLAETYRIYDYRALPARRAALFACGLRADSRIAQSISHTEVPIDTLLLATIADALKILVWQNTEDGAKGRNHPSGILDALLHRGEQESESMGFESAEDFLAWREHRIGGGDNG